MSADSADSVPSPRSAFATTLQIVSVVSFTFICYLTIGLPLAVLPGFVHDELGFSAIVAGAALAHRGQIAVATDRGAGSCFRLTLPAAWGTGAPGAMDAGAPGAVQERT